jgi:hypothetical protein
MGVTELLTLIFIVLKLTGVINWSWWLVLLPELLAFVLYTLFVLSAVIVGARAEMEFKRERNKRTF